jgi:protein-disulfide isomerase
MSYDHNHSFFFVSPSTQDRIKGVLSADVMLVMYGDYECSESANVYRLIKALCFVFRHFPQVQIHPHAQRAAQAVEAAAAQGQFWQMHDILFAHQQELGNGYLVEYADRLGLDISQFLQDISKQVHVARINEDIESGLHNGVTVAPALFINGIRYSDRWNSMQLTAAIVSTSRS